MRISLATAVVAVGLCVLVAGLSLADGTTEHQTAVKLYRGLSIVAASDPNHRTYRPGFTMASCTALKTTLGEAEKQDRDSGIATYSCRFDDRDIITFHTAPPPTCPDRPAPDEQQVLDCPSGTVGTWLQDRVWTLQPYPDCWAQGDWTPSEPPEGMCAPDTPPEPQLLPAPTNVQAVGTSTSMIEVTWGPGSAADRSYLVRRCIGSTCEPLDRTPLICTTALRQRHGPLQSEGLTVSYRIQASAVADCTNPGVPSEIARGTTLTSTTPEPPTPDPDPEPEPAPVGTGTLPWEAPTRNTDGSILSDLAGFRVVWGQDPNALTNVEQVGADARNFTVTGLPPGTWYFAVKAYNTSGRESDLSVVRSKVIQ